MTRASACVAVLLFCIVAAAPGAAADNCSTPADCEATSDYNFGISVGGGIIAIIVAGILGLLPPGTTSTITQITGTGAGGGKKWVDPFTGTELTVQDGKKPGGGNVGDVWIGGKWRPPAEAQEIINDRQREIDKENAYNDQKAREGQEMVQQGTKDRAKQLQAEADKEKADRLADEQAERNRKRRQQLEEEQEKNVKDQTRDNSWTGWISNVSDEFWDKTTKEVDDLPRDLQNLGRDILNTGTKVISNTIDALKDPQNWKDAGTSLINTVTDPIKLLTGDADAWDRAVNKLDTMGKIGKVVVDVGSGIIKKAVTDPVGFVKDLTPIQAWQDAMDPNRSLIDRIGRTWLATADTLLTFAGGKVATEAVEQGAKAAAKNAAEEAAEAAAKALGKGGLPPGLDPKKLDAINDAWKGRIAKSDTLVDNFKNSQKQLDAAKATGNAQDIARAQEAARQAAIQLQKDKIAIQRLNGTKDAAAIDGFKDNLKTIYNNTDDKMVDWAKGKGHIGKDAVEIKSNVPGQRVFQDGDGNKLILSEPTNPPKPIKPGDPPPVPKAGADRDFTMSTQKPGQPVKDIPHTQVKQPYNDNFYEASTGKKMPPPDSPDYPTARKDADDFAKKMDQAVTGGDHPEMYGKSPRDLDIATGRGTDGDNLNIKGKAFTDSAQIGDAVTYKGDHWFNAKHVDSDEAFFEGSRQVTKQFENQANGRFQAIKDNLDVWKAEGKVPQSVNVKPPDVRLQAGVDIMKRVDNMQISPAQARAELQALGMTPQDVSRGVGDYVDALQRIAPGSVKDAMGARG